MTAGGPWGGPDSPQSPVPLCPVCLHPVRSEAHYAAVERMSRRADEMRARDAARRTDQIARAFNAREPVERTLREAEDIRRRLTEKMEPGSISAEQRTMIAALLIEREPVFQLASMSEFLTRILGEEWPARRNLWDLSAQQAGDILEALEAERRRPRHAVTHDAKHRADESTRQTNGAHRAADN